MILSPLERGKGGVSKPFVDDNHTPLPLSRGDLTKGTIYLLTQSVIQSEAKNLENIHVYPHHCVTEIFRTESSTTRLPPFGRLNDNFFFLSVFQSLNLSVPI